MTERLSVDASLAEEMGAPGFGSASLSVGAKTLTAVC